MKIVNLGIFYIVNIDGLFCGRGKGMIMISVCMIVKNEEDVLTRCVESIEAKLVGVVNEIIVVDTGSTDSTKEMALNLGCSVYDFEWCNDFSKARNHSIGKASNDWVLIIDADEFVVDVEVNNIKDFVREQDNAIMGEVEIVSYGDEKAERYDISRLARLFNKNYVKYVRSIHEVPVNIDKTIKEKLCNVGLVLHHSGYITSVKKEKGKTERNFNMLISSLEKNEDKYLRLHLAKTYIELEDYSNAILELEKVINDKDSIKYTYYSETVKEYIRCLIANEEFEKCLRCEKFWDRCYSNCEYVYFMGHAYLKNGYFEKAMDCFFDVLNRKNSTTNKKEAMYSLGQMFGLLGMYEESATYYEMCGEYSDAKECVLDMKARI